jgi:hypothetical protein
LDRHQVKVGGEIMRASLSESSGFSGGAVEQVLSPGQIFDYARYGNGNGTAEQLAGSGASSNPYVLNDANNTFRSQFSNSVYSINIAGFVQDSWNILENLTAQGGVRFDDQILHGGPDYSLPGQPTHAVPFILSAFSPRAGLIYDPVGNGRSKLFASYGRFNEYMPLSLVSRAFPHQEEVQTTRSLQNCNVENPLVCEALSRDYLRSTPETVLNPLQPQGVDTYTAGAEYQVFKDLLSGLSYTASRMSALIEDYSTNNGSTFTVGDIGKQAYSQALVQPNAVTGQLYEFTWTNYQRNYDGINAYLTKTMGHNFIGHASYTLSWLRGVEAGLYVSETGELHPNNNNTFNAASLFPNVYGYLNTDHRHQFKIDGAYLYSVNPNFLITPNIRFRAGSGSPYSLTGANPQFGPAQAYILPRGLGGDMDWLFGVDIGLKAEQIFRDKTRLSYGITAINVFDFQTGIHADERYALNSQYIYPIAGGTTSMVPYVKTYNGTPAVLNPSFGLPTAYELPIEVRIDVKYTF